MEREEEEEEEEEEEKRKEEQKEASGASEEGEIEDGTPLRASPLGSGQNNDERRGFLWRMLFPSNTYGATMAVV